MSNNINYQVIDQIAVIEIDNPPVNAVDLKTRLGITQSIDQLNSDKHAKGAVIICTGRTFIAGADIQE